MPSFVCRAIWTINSLQSWNERVGESGAAARRLRLEEWRKIAGKAISVALGHHADDRENPADQAEARFQCIWFGLDA